MLEFDFINDVEIIYSILNKLILRVSDISKVILYEESSKERDKSLKKNGKRKMVVRFLLFNEDDRVKFFVSDWSFIKVDIFDDEVYKMEDMKVECEIVIKIDFEIEIIFKDLKIMYEFGKGMVCSKE